MQRNIREGAHPLPVVTVEGLLDSKTGIGVKAPSTIWRWVKRGTFPKPMKLGSRTIWLQKDIIEWQMQQARKAAGIQDAEVIPERSLEAA